MVGLKERVPLQAVATSCERIFPIMSTRIPAAHDDALVRPRSARRPWLRKRLLVPLAAAALLIPAGTALACVTPGGPWTPPANAAPPQQTPPQDLPPLPAPPFTTPPEHKPSKHKPSKHKPSCKEHHKKCTPSTPGSPSAPSTPVTTPSTPVSTPSTPVSTPSTPSTTKGGNGCTDTTNASCKVVTGTPSFTG
jgi:outer membrane biosynthesis protein TonB